MKESEEQTSEGLSNLTVEEKNNFEKWALEFVPRLMRAVLQQGAIDTEGKTDEEIEEEFRNVIYEWTDESQHPFIFVYDHTDDLIDNARKFASEKKYEIATLFYATWLEHWINHLIATLAIRRNMNSTIVDEIIRGTQIRGKFTWVLHLFGVPPIDSSHVNTIMRITDRRNSFVHYKWKHFEDDVWEQKKEELRLEIASFESTISYLEKYQDTDVFGQADEIMQRILAKRGLK